MDFSGCKKVDCFHFRVWREVRLSLGWECCTGSYSSTGREHQVESEKRERKHIYTYWYVYMCESATEGFFLPFTMDGIRMDENNFSF